MKKAITSILAICGLLLLPVATQAQVWLNFESSAGMDFSIPTWSEGAISSLAWAADPTGESDGVMQIGLSTSGSTLMGTIERNIAFGVEGAEVMILYFYLPSDFPDDGEIILFGQDNEHWSDAIQASYLGVNLPKETWVPVSFDLLRLANSSDGDFDPYDNEMGNIRIRFGFSTVFSGNVLVDNITWVGAEPIAWDSFESAVDFTIPDWSGGGIGSVGWLSDTTGVSSGVMAVGLTTTASTPQGTIEKCCSFDANDADVVAFNFYLPTDFPDAAIIKIWSQDASAWAWYDQSYTGSDLPKETWVAVNFDMRRFSATAADYDPYTNLIGKIGLQVYYEADYTGQILVDDLRYLGHEVGARWVYADFEIEGLGEQGFAYGWGSDLLSVARIADPTGTSDAVLGLELDASQGENGAFANEGIPTVVGTDTASALTYDVYIPDGFPTSAIFKVFAQDLVAWAWNADEYTGLTAGWHTLTFDIAARLATDPNYAAGIKTGIEIYFGTGGTFVGSVYVDNVTLVGVEKPTAFLTAPDIWQAERTTETSPYGKKIRYNEIRWVPADAALAPSYTLYRSTTPITTLDGVAILEEDLPSDADHYLDAIYTTDAGDRTYYYALTVTGLDSTTGTTMSTLGPSITAAITGKTMQPPVIALNPTGFSPVLTDSDIDDFREVVTSIPGCRLLPENVPDGWTVDSDDLNFEMYIVISGGTLYVGMEMIDDDPTSTDQAWAGDGFDIFIGFYDADTVSAGGYLNHSNTSLSDADKGDYRISYAMGYEECTFERDGYECWSPDGLSETVTNFGDGYVVEFSIPLASLTDGPAFTPAEGMFIPFKIDLNDQDPVNNPDLRRSDQLHVGGLDNSESWLRPGAWGKAYVSSIGIVATDEGKDHLADQYSLAQNYPNPFNPITTINFTVPNNELVKLEVYNILGQRVTTLVDGYTASGTHSVVWNGTDFTGKAVASGIYFYRIEAGDFRAVKKTTLLK